MKPRETQVANSRQTWTTAIVTKRKESHFQPMSERRLTAHSAEKRVRLPQRFLSGQKVLTEEVDEGVTRRPVKNKRPLRALVLYIVSSHAVSRT